MEKRDDLRDLSIGTRSPEWVDAVVEIPRESRIKYEYDRESGLFRVSRVLIGAMRYPMNYGFIPGTLAADGDCLDILIGDSPPLLVGSILSVEVLGMLSLRDRGIEDVKILGRPEYLGTDGLQGMEGRTAYLETIRHFYLHYKELEGKPVEIKGWAGREEAYAAIDAARHRYLAACAPTARQSDSRLLASGSEEANA